MKPSKKKAAKRPSNPIISKLLDLKYRIREAYNRTTLPTDDPNRLSLTLLGDTRIDKQWVMKLIDDVRGNNLSTLCKEDMLKCNGLWRKYE